MVARRSSANRRLQSLVSYGVSLYEIGEMRRTRCADLREAAIVDRAARAELGAIGGGLRWGYIGGEA
jgi:hypothetical protein